MKVHVKNRLFIKIIAVIVIALSSVLGCSGGGSGSSDNSGGKNLSELWTWISGSELGSQKGTYGTKGIPDVSNIPGAREDSISWTDSSGNLWLFGGSGQDVHTNLVGKLNDLWRFDGATWTWISGSDRANQSGTYGIKGTADASNIPGGRENSISWVDSSGNLWLFGGEGYDSSGTLGALNDLWKFDGAEWTWVSGSDTVNESGTYGIKGTPNALNIPGARYGSISWIDSSGNLWLFGGEGYDSSGTIGYLNDLWGFNGAVWVWKSGSDSVDQSGIYGTQGTPDALNTPGGREDSISWIDSSDNLWLFSGWGLNGLGHFGNLNDLWRFDGEEWTWISGSHDRVNQGGTYGIKGTPDASNIPGARANSISWIDSSGNLWLFGGSGIDSTPIGGYLNDLWRFDGTEWTWISGSDRRDIIGIYGTQGTPDVSNIPGGRYGSVGWIDLSGNLWLFGGNARISSSSTTLWNDLWRYVP